jgi:hypothetical protein
VAASLPQDWRGGQVCDSASEGWQKIAGGKQRDATGKRPVDAFQLEGVAFKPGCLAVARRFRSLQTACHQALNGENEIPRSLKDRSSGYGRHCRVINP